MTRRQEALAAVAALIASAAYVAIIWMIAFHGQDCRSDPRSWVIGSVFVVAGCQRPAWRS